MNRRRNAFLPGRFESWLSIPTVTRELLRAIKTSRKYNRVSIFSTENIGIEAERAKYGLYRGIPDGVHIEMPHVENTVAFTFGHPAGIHQWISAYPIRIAGVICEGDFVGPDWVAVCNQSTASWAPSDWVMSRYRHHGARGRFEVFPHGVHAMMRPLPDMRDPDRFSILHVTHGNFHDRKGTRELILAFQQAFFGQHDVRLVIVTTNPEDLAPLLQGESRIEVEVPSEPLGPENMCILLNMVHAYVAPSRSEGYGLIPCEARACHTPVALTNATGHMQHFREGVDVAIETAPADVLTTDLISNSEVASQGQTIAPRVEVDAIAAALKDLYDHWDLHHANLIASVAERSEPTWAEAMSPLVEWSLKLAEERSDVVRF